MSDIRRGPPLSVILGGEASRSPAYGAILPKRNGGGSGNGTKARLAKLEGSLGNLERDVGELRAEMRDLPDRLGRIESRANRLPGKGFLVMSVIVMLAAIAAMIAFQDEVGRLVRQVPGLSGPAAEAPPPARP